MRRKDYISHNSEKQIHSFYGFPAVRLYWNGGKLRTLGWYNKGILHRLNGPAFITFNIYDETIKKSYYIFGKKINKEEFDLESNRIKMLNNL